MAHLKFLTLLGVFLTAGLASWSMELLPFRNSNYLSEMSSVATKDSYLRICVSLE